MAKVYHKLPSYKGISDHLTTKEMCKEWGMRPVDHVYSEDGTYKGTTGNVYQFHENWSPEIRFGPDYGNVDIDQCAGIWSFDY